MIHLFHQLIIQLVCLHVHSLSKGHAFDLINEDTVCFDINLSLKFQPGLDQGCIAALVFSQAMF